MRIPCALLLGLLALTTDALSHHSYALFAVDKTLTLTGIESSSPAIWRKYGGSRDMLKPGDRVTVLMHPLRSGASGGLLERITIADGKTIDLTAPLP